MNSLPLIKQKLNLIRELTVAKSNIIKEQNAYYVPFYVGLLAFILTVIVSIDWANFSKNIFSEFIAAIALIAGIVVFVVLYFLYKNWKHFNKLADWNRTSIIYLNELTYTKRLSHKMISFANEHMGDDFVPLDETTPSKPKPNKVILSKDKIDWSLWIALAIELIAGYFLYLFVKGLNQPTPTGLEIVLFLGWAIALCVTQWASAINITTVTKDSIRNVTTVLFFLASSFFGIGIAFLLNQQMFLFGKLMLVLSMVPFFGGIALYGSLREEGFYKILVKYGIACFIITLVFFLYVVGYVLFTITPKTIFG